MVASRKSSRRNKLPRKHEKARMTTLMIVKLLGIIGLGGAFVGWQFYDLAQEKKRAVQNQKQNQKQAQPDQLDQPKSS